MAIPALWQSNEMMRRFFAKRSNSGILGDTSRGSVAENTYIEEGNQWYLPVLAGPSTFMTQASSAATIRQVLEVLNKLSSDKYLEFIRRFYNRGLSVLGDQWVYADINTVLHSVSRLLRPKRYLEIGVRRGRSMAVVVSQSPRCDVTGFDLWVENYAGMDNPGEAFVREDLARIGHRGSAEFIAGDSRLTVPQYFRDNPQCAFDLVTVDGDHSVAGARRDLLAVMPRVKTGGVVVFDDTCNQSHPGLAELWDEVVVRNSAFAALTFNEVGFGVGLAVRKRASAGAD